VTRPATRPLAELSADELVAAVHPYGQWSGPHTAGAAAQLAELVRYLNHATLDRPGEALPDPNIAAADVRADRQGQGRDQPGQG